MLATIGYEKADLDHFVGTLLEAKIDIIIDIRDRAQSRRKGFSKTALSNKLEEFGIAYVHFRELGDPKEGREAARAGNYPLFKKIFGEVMRSDDAQASLEKITNLAKDNKVCLLCYERNHKECHRKIVSDHLESVLNTKAKHLGVQAIEPVQKPNRRMLHSDQGAAA